MTRFHLGLFRWHAEHCDEYFWLKHRNESRGIGGIFYDDVNESAPGMPLNWDQGFALMQHVGNAYHDAYFAIMNRRRDTPFGERERNYQLHRRGRYVEFNLVFRLRHAVRTAVGRPHGGHPGIHATGGALVLWQPRCRDGREAAALSDHVAREGLAGGVKTD